eukprot:CAMPEP_0183521572 /NCGR_PEP_ID=MMETSP0371-20130417/17769_1 /TAXON_ID=268820 /ORGANISM="Peridinium aciculiferum, Strain PAER-2" /LENGTH=137 /DNA_ID=CAMNT_0025720145 /DNA_START=138 /DNA_END=551 /DNA_ORIENTATION=+
MSPSELNEPLQITPCCALRVNLYEHRETRPSDLPGLDQQTRGCTPGELEQDRWTRARAATDHSMLRASCQSLRTQKTRRTRSSDSPGLDQQTCGCTSVSWIYGKGHEPLQITPCCALRVNLYEHNKKGGLALQTRRG